MSFFKSIFNAVCDAGSELLDKQQDYAEGFEGMSDYQLKQLYREMRAHPYNVDILNGAGMRRTGYRYLESGSRTPAAVLARSLLKNE